MQALTTREYQPHALGQQAALDWLAAPAQPSAPCPFAIGTNESAEWSFGFKREIADYNAVRSGK